jgi:integrase
MAFPSKAQAQAWAAKIEADIAAGKAGLPTSKSLADAIDLYLKEVAPHKRGERWEKIRLAKLKRDLPFADKAIGRITPVDITTWAQQRAQMPNPRRPGKGMAPNSILRDATVMGAVFRYATRTLRWLDESPMRNAVLPKPGKSRNRRIKDNELEALIAACGYKYPDPPTNATQRVALAMLFAIETCMRTGEICSLERSQIYERHVHLLKTKNGDEREVPLSTRAREILKLLPNELGPAFGLSAATLDVLFRRIRAAAGERVPSVKSIHFHDTRREAASRLSKRLEVMELARMGGWRNVNILYKTYYSIPVEDIADKLG